MSAPYTGTFPSGPIKQRADALAIAAQLWRDAEPYVVLDIAHWIITGGRIHPATVAGPEGDR